MHAEPCGFFREGQDALECDFISFAPISPTSLFYLLGTVPNPRNTGHEGEIFQVLISVPQEDPTSPPECKFTTKIQHPNVDEDGRIRLKILGEK